MIRLGLLGCLFLLCFGGSSAQAQLLRCTEPDVSGSVRDVTIEAKTITLRHPEHPLYVEGFVITDSSPTVFLGEAFEGYSKIHLDRVTGRLTLRLYAPKEIMAVFRDYCSKKISRAECAAKAGEFYGIKCSVDPRAGCPRWLTGIVSETIYMCQVAKPKF
jgi:hypothetical protein